MDGAATDVVKIFLPIGDITYSFDLYFLLSLLLGMFVVAMFSWNKFGESTEQKSEDDYVTQLLPKFLATNQDYSRALALYIMTMIAVLVVLSLLGPRAISLVTNSKIPEGSAAVPLFVALVLVGVIPNAPFLPQLELTFRRFAHARAYIPAAARTATDSLAAADFNFSTYTKVDALKSPWLRGVKPEDMTYPRGSVEYNWARLSLLIYQIKQRDLAQLSRTFDGELLRRYNSDLDNIVLKRRSLEDEVNQFRQQKVQDPYHLDEDLLKKIRSALDRLYVLLGCAALLKYGPSADWAAPLAPFGFSLSRHRGMPRNSNVMIVGITVMACSVLIATYLAIIAAAFHPNSWTPSEHFPQRAVEPFLWAISALLTQGSAIFAADWYRRRRLGKNHWFESTGGKRHRVVANYIRVAIVCAIAGYVVLFLWALLFEAFSKKVALNTLPFVLLPAVTGAFYAIHLDSVELKRRPSRLLEIGLQATITALCTLVAMHLWLYLTNSVLAYDLLALAATNGVVIGGSLGWYLPRAAESTVDLLADAQEARALTLRDKALKRFEDEEKAEAWLNSSNSDLNDMTPTQAAAEVVTFERTLSLLRQAPGAQVERTDTILQLTARVHDGSTTEELAAVVTEAKRHIEEDPTAGDFVLLAARALRRLGRLDEAIKLLTDYIEVRAEVDDPDDDLSLAYYNRACYRCLLHKIRPNAALLTSALADLGKSLKISPYSDELKLYARKDTDLADLRDMPEFAELVAIPMVGVASTVTPNTRRR